VKNKEKYKVRAQAVYNFLNAFPEKHDQDSFVEGVTTNLCGTTMCIAGTAVFLDGGVKALTETLEGDRPDFDVQARELLGLTRDESRALFYTYDNENALKALKALIKGNKEKFEKHTSRY
jgi:hypothetical protein